MTKFFLNVLEEVKEETEKGQKQEIMKLILKKDERLAKIWEVVVTRKSKKEQSLMEVLNDITDSELNDNGE
ncbi:16386_t:CDS:2 [Acaulospora morrowiae]|uniref:16386_t:CDS:1 n=1 Tax=Acaulospora morrowiae TaxID=94023 RepID=A0A9N9A2I2_9GLOM|nr:16386_t:CDS:2 [Acaulospora morrowiae]